MKNQTSKVEHHKPRRGFSLIEIMISLVLMGIAITAMVVATGSFTMANGAGADLSTAEFLVEQIRELTAMMAVVDPESGIGTFGPEEGSLSAYDDIDDLNGATYSPPIGADKSVLSQLTGFSQHIVVQNVDQSNFNTVVANHSSKFVRITVTVSLNGRPITTASWLRTRYQSEA